MTKTKTKTEPAIRVCIFPGCCNTQATRGLCQGHYTSSTRAIREGRATDADLVRRGLYLPKGANGRSPIARGSSEIFNKGSKAKGDAAR